MDSPDDRWKALYNPEPDDEGPQTLEEIRVVREFVECSGTSHEIKADDAARSLISLCHDTRQVGFDKGERISRLLWATGIEMPQYQPAILKLVEVIKALPQLERTKEQIHTRQFEQKWERWRDMEAFDEIWWKTWQRSLEPYARDPKECHQFSYNEPYLANYYA
ncbi:hypothetical protein IFM46972_04925 [Aspergillus udagawae]|uniref:Uncharacterized protein n=1 Tax=Aspergillus udagawae TaxID=91492 RepID=A0A8H3NQE4_9EURO|nr:hypothetical protein IFM46972_04925 [Aspergillus udagawae]